MSLLAEQPLLSQFISIKYRHSTTYAVVTIRNVQCKSNFGQIGLGTRMGTFYVHTREPS